MLQVGQDILDIPRVLKKIMTDWDFPIDSLNRMPHTMPHTMLQAPCIQCIRCTTHKLLHRACCAAGMSAWTFTALLKKRMRLHDESNHDGSVDLLLSGCEVSLWLAEQFHSDLHRVFPKLKIVVLRANHTLIH